MAGDNMLKLGIPKGSLQDATIALFEKSGWKIRMHHRNYFPEINDPELTCSMCRAQEMSRYVESGTLDCGLTGKDWILENESDVVVVSDLVYSKVSNRPARWVLAVAADSPYKRPEDLAGKKIGVVTGSTGDDIASREFGKTNNDIRRFESTPVIISELVNSGVDAAIGDNGVIAFRVQEHKQLKTVSDANFPKEYFGIVVKQGNKALRDKLNAGLAAVKADGSYAQIYKKWFQAEAPALPAQ